MRFIVPSSVLQSTGLAVYLKPMAAAQAPMNYVDAMGILLKHWLGTESKMALVRGPDGAMRI